jgi:tetratricopeptide (TPR) repeat protein
MPVAPQSAGPVIPIEVFYSYAHEDEQLKDELVKHLASLRRQGVINEWYDRDISAGREWDDEIKNHLDSASVILLLISPDFMNSNYCNDVEVTRAIERNDAGEARVIPVILRPVDWEGAPFSKLKALPTDVQPVTSWENQDEAFLDVTKGIRKAVQELSGPLAAVPALPDLPRPPRVGFVSRRDKDGRDIVERLQEELAPHKNQLVALWGAGGVGKTTLAAEAVSSLVETSGQRVVWITADGRADFSFSTLLDDIAGQLGRTDMRPLAPEPKEEALRSLIAAAPTLIVLDNFETISPVEQLLCKNFLAQHARCSALITTRERIDNAYLIPLAAMSHDEANEYLERLIKQTQDADIYAAVDRERILRTAEFNPLIIQWIVAQIDLAQDPLEVLDDLAHGEGDAAERVFDRSFNLPQMAQGGRAVLLALSLFMPDAARSMLGEVAGMGKDKDRKKFKKAQQTLASLWLVKQRDGGPRLAVEGLTRELAKTRLDKDIHGKTFRQRFVARFLRYAKAHAQPTPHDYEAMETEKDNVLSAMDVAFGIGDWLNVQDIAITVAEPVEGMLSVHGYWDEALRRNEQALKAARNSTVNDSIAAFTHNAAVMYQNRGEIEEARKLYNESLEIEKKLGNQRGIASTLHNLASLSQAEGKLEEARKLYDESLEIAKKLGDQGGIAITLHQLAMLAQDEGKLEEARKLYDESLEIEKKLGNRSGIAISLLQFGILAEREGNKIEAERLYREALSIFERLGSPYAEVAREHLKKLESESE